jgi:tRNA A-37 threonylcarbamoyl transferase component Bud32
LTPIAFAADDSERALIRRCIRGGILGRFLKEAYLNIGRPRPLKELLVSEYARTSNIPTPKVVAAVVERANPLWYRGALVTREVSPGVDLQEEALAFDPHDLEAVRSKRRCIDSLGRLIGRMHAAGIYHADLHLKNILKSGEKLYLLDLDAARICRPLPERRKLMNLLRLYRSAQKINRRRPVITRADLLRFARAYSAESNISQENLLRDIREMLPLWRLKWRLSDLLKI